MSEEHSPISRPLAASLEVLASCAKAVELLMGARVASSPPALLDQFLKLRNLGLAFRSEDDPMAFRIHTRLRIFINQLQGIHSSLGELDEDHAALLAQCDRLHVRYLRAREAGEDGALEIDEFESWAYALGDALDQSLLSFDAHLASNLSRAKTARQREEAAKEAVSKAEKLSKWLGALNSSSLRRNLAEEPACAKLLAIYDEALITRGKMTRRLQRCLDCLERLREQLGSARRANQRHELLAQASRLDENGFLPFGGRADEISDLDLAAIQALTPKARFRAPIQFDPSQAQHARAMERSARKAALWAADLEATLSPAPANKAPAGSLHPIPSVLPKKTFQLAFDAFLDDLFTKGSELSVCGWLMERQLDGSHLDLDCQAWLAWSCSRQPGFYRKLDIGLALDSEPGGRLDGGGRILDARFRVELQEEAA